MENSYVDTGAFLKNAFANYSKHNNSPSSFHRNPDHEFH